MFGTFLLIPNSIKGTTLFGILDHALDFGLAETALVVVDGDRVLQKMG